MNATELELEILSLLRGYGPLTIDTIAYDLDLVYDNELVGLVLSMRKRKWIDGDRTGGYVVSDRFQWLRDIK